MDDPENIEIRMQYSTPFIQKKKESSFYKKISDELESFFERLAGPGESWDRCESVQGITALVGFACGIDQIVSIFVCFSSPMSDNGLLLSIITKFMSVCPLMLSLMCVLSAPHKYEYRCHFSDIGMSRIVAIGVYMLTVAWIFTVAASVGINVCDVIAMLCIFAISILSIVGALMHAQKCTKLRIQPTRENHIYVQDSLVTRDKGTVQIVESTVFKITLRNRGREPWDSKGFKLHRHASTGVNQMDLDPPPTPNPPPTPPRNIRDGDCANFMLPEFTIQPRHVVYLIPETAEVEGNSEEDYIRIPKFHCFGLFDRHKQVKTYISLPTNRFWDNDRRREDDYCLYEKKIAEQIVTYKRNEWPNVNVRQVR